MWPEWITVLLQAVVTAVVLGIIGGVGWFLKARITDGWQLFIEWLKRLVEATEQNKNETSTLRKEVVSSIDGLAKAVDEHSRLHGEHVRRFDKIEAVLVTKQPVDLDHRTQVK